MTFQTASTDFDAFVRRANEEKELFSRHLERQALAYADHLAALHADVEQILQPWTATGRIVLIYEDVEFPSYLGDATVSRRMTIMLGDLHATLVPVFPSWADVNGGVEIESAGDKSHMWIADPTENGSGREMARWVIDPGRGGLRPRAFTKSSFLELLMRLLQRN